MNVGESLWRIENMSLYPTFTSSPPKFHIYDNLCGYQPEYYKCKLSKGLAKCAAEMVPILPKL